MSSKIFILDTSAVMSLVQDVTTYRKREYPAFAGVLGDNEIIIPRVVLDELDGLKRDKGERGKTAVACARQLEHYSILGNLVEGVETEKGGIIRIAPRPAREKIDAWGLKANTADHEIIATALELEDQQEGESRKAGGKGDSSEIEGVVLISQDRLLRVLARSVYGLQAEELMSICAPQLGKEPGYRRIDLSSEELDKVIEEDVYESPEQLPVNEMVHLVDKDNPKIRYAYGMARDEESNNVDILDRSHIDFLKVAGEVQGLSLIHI